MEDMEKRIDQLDERNKVLEKRYRTQQSVVFILLILVLWSVIRDVKASFWPGRIEASSVVIEDSDSGASAELDARGLAFWDENEALRVTLANDAGGPRLGLLDEKGKQRLQLRQDDDGPSLSLLDENEKWRVHLYQEAESCRFFFCDDEGKPGFSAALDAGGPKLDMWKEGQVVFEAPGE